MIKTVGITLVFSFTAAAKNLSCNLGDVLPDPTIADTNSDPLLYHPRFHIMPPTRISPPGSYAPEGMNDMNPVFQSPNGKFHIMYQDHLNCPDDLNQGNQTFGHVVSDDLWRWEHLPPALVDDEEYDGGEFINPFRDPFLGPSIPGSIPGLPLSERYLFLILTQVLVQHWDLGMESDLCVRGCLRLSTTATLEEGTSTSRQRRGRGCLVIGRLRIPSW